MRHCRHRRRRPQHLQRIHHRLDHLLGDSHDGKARQQLFDFTIGLCRSAATCPSTTHHRGHHSRKSPTHLREDQLRLLICSRMAPGNEVRSCSPSTSPCSHSLQPTRSTRQPGPRFGSGRMSNPRSRAQRHWHQFCRSLATERCTQSARRLRR